MILVFYKQLTHFIHKAFKALFGVNDKHDYIHKLNLNIWYGLAHLALLKTGIYTIFPYENKIIRDALNLIKNKKDEDVAHILCLVAKDVLLEELSQYAIFSDFENPIITGVPPHRDQYRKRGFNPSSLIAEKLGAHFNIEYIHNLLVFIRDTKAQKTLARKSRFENMRFSMDIKHKYSQKILNRPIIVIDDVTTTGATLSEARRALKKHTSRIICIALAH